MTTVHPAERLLPSGTVAFLFTDIEGSTRLLSTLGDDYSEVLFRQRQLLRAAFAGGGGHEVDTQGDGHFAVFSDAASAVGAAVAAQQGLARERWPHDVSVRVRMGVHVGEAMLTDEGYIGLDVHRAARIAGASHGGQILASEPVMHGVTAQRPSSTEFVDLGEVRLKDLDRPERLYSVIVPGLEPQLQRPVSLDVPTNLPAPTSELIGRSQDIEAVTARLARDDIRLLTITGAGGIGKTRVAVEAARTQQSRFTGGLFFVGLETVASEAGVLAQIATTLQIQEREAGVEQAMFAYLMDRKTLLVLDNFEHVLSAAGLVGRLLAAAPLLKVLVTSRRALRVRGEHELLLQPLSLPDSQDEVTGEAAARSDAVQLFYRRAREAVPTFDADDEHALTILQLCRRLDGLPLAIELAAARIAVLSPAQILQRVERQASALAKGAVDAPERQRTLEATIAWSADLLTAEEQRGFRVLAACAGGFTLPTAEAILPDTLDALAVVEALTASSLVTSSEDEDGYRFRMLQTVRDFGVAQLDREPDATEIRLGLAAYFAELAEQQAGDLLGGDQATTLRRINAEIDNLRALLAWTLHAPGDAAVFGLRQASALRHFWEMRALPAEGARWLDAALRAAPDADPLLRAEGMHNLGVLLERSGEYERAEQMLRAALELFRAAGDTTSTARQLNSLGVLEFARENLTKARALLNEALVLRTQRGDEDGVASTQCNLALVTLEEGDAHGAERLLRETVELDRASGNSWGITIDMANLANVLLQQGRLDEAAEMAARSAAQFDELGDVDGIAECLEVAAGIATGQGRYLRCVRLVGAASRRRRDGGSVISPPSRRRVDRYLDAARTALQPDLFDAALTDGENMTLRQSLEYGFSPEGAA